MKFDLLTAYTMFDLAGFKVTSITEIPNDYWPRTSLYEQLRAESPWFVVGTTIGAVRIGWRKRVISIEWDSSTYSGIITEDDTTKDQHMVHAWTNADAVKYLSNLREAAYAAKNRRPTQVQVESNESV